jgi:hypothetical protein
MIEIYDIDGTLTYGFGDIPNLTQFATYAFWPLLTEKFTKDVDGFRKRVREWEESMVTESDPALSSHTMMQEGINTFQENVTHQEIRAFAKEVTLQFIHYGVIREEAIAYLSKKVNLGIVCILSTGSYQDGALGFVDALVETGLITQEAGGALRVSGAIVDWKKRELLHANVRERKIKGIEMLLGDKIENIRPNIAAVYADDPWINDHGILEIAPPEKAFVIQTEKNKNQILPGHYVFSTWRSIIDR